MTDINSLKHEHGNEFHIPFKRATDINFDIVAHQRNIAFGLVNLFALNMKDTNNFVIPCMQCFKDMILECEDMARLMKELIEPNKVKK